ncbi:MAG TPA: divalent-cation tolerance protein CutA [Streptosporangiaceae bacterium]|nr:divalent-cation tolerance protein CutA [Streptosporangiaceae bacterium]
MTELCEVVITAPDPEWLYSLTRVLVASGLCASAHNFTPVRTVYKWQGRIYERTEGRASLHTRAELVSRIVDRVRAEGHPYQVPGISARLITGGNPEYLQWIADETSSGDERHADER